MGKYFKEDNNQRVSKASRNVNINALTSNSIRTAGIREWALNALGKLTKPELRKLFAAGDIYTDARGQLAIKNLGSVLKFLNVASRAEKTLGSNPIFQLVSGLVQSKGIQLILSIVKFLPAFRKNDKIAQILQKSYVLNVYGKGNTIVQETAPSLESILTQVATGKQVSINGQKLAPQSEAVFNEILKDINEIEILARKDKALSALIVGAGGAAIHSVVVGLSFSDQAKLSNAVRDLAKANETLKMLSVSQVGSYEEWITKPANHNAVMRALTPENQEKFNQALTASKEARNTINVLERKKQLNEGK